MPIPTLITFDYPPEHGGIQQYAARLSEALVARGCATLVVAPHAAGDAAYDATRPVRVVRFRNARGPWRVASAAVRYLSLRSRAPDRHTIALSWLPGCIATLSVPRGRSSITVLVHGTELDVKPGSLRDRVMRFVFRRADRVVANSGFVARRVRALGLADDVEVIWPGVDAWEARRAPNPTPTVVFVGRLVPRKGVDRLIDAVALLHDRNVALEIVGDGPQRAELEKLAERHGIAERVRFHGSVDNKQRNAVLASGWCFAMPARREGGDVEGFGIAYLEAAMAGLPAIGGAGSGAEDAVVDGATGLLVDGTDVAAIAAAIARLIDDPQRAAAMGAAGRERALREFSWAANAAAFVELLGRGDAV